MNLVIQHGRLVRDPELSYLQNDNNTPICKFSIAVPDRAGKEKKVYFHDIVMYGKLGEVISQYFRKGSEIIISGKLIQDRWQGKDGSNQQKRYIKATEFNFCGSQGQTQNTQHSPNNPPNNPPMNSSSPGKNQQPDFNNPNEPNDPFADFNADDFLGDNEVPF